MLGFNSSEKQRLDFVHSVVLKVTATLAEQHKLLTSLDESIGIVDDAWKRNHDELVKLREEKVEMMKLMITLGEQVEALNDQHAALLIRLAQLENELQKQPTVGSNLPPSQQ